MFGSLGVILAGIALVLLISVAWMATVAFVCWDMYRRELSLRQQLKWAALSVVPFVGFAAYLLNRPGSVSPAAPRKRVTILKPQRGTELRQPTIAAVQHVWAARQNRQAPFPPADVVSACILGVTRGPHQGQEFVIDRLPALIGRVTGATVRLDRDLGVSRRHAELYEQEGVLRLRDLNSRHGTHINDQSIADQELVPGDTIRVGLSQLVLRDEKGGDTQTGLGHNL